MPLPVSNKDPTSLVRSLETFAFTLSMDHPTAHLAIDLGAESGRLIVGVLSGPSGLRHLEIAEVHRFDNVPLRQLGESHWDFESLKREIFIGMKATAAWCLARSLPLASVGVDSWGVDYALLGPDGYLLAAPRTYRDARHAAGLAALDLALDRPARFALSGVAPSTINTLAQLRARADAGDPDLARCSHIAMIADLIHHLLSGELASETCLASTTEMLDAARGTWSVPLAALSASGAGAAIIAKLLPVRPPGTVLGPLRFDVATRTRVGQQCQVVLPAALDTACAVAAVPAVSAPGNSTWAFISSGTCSLIGVESAAAALSAKALKAGLTNERAAAAAETHTFRTQHNLVGLFVLAELRRDLRQRGKNYSYDQLIQLATATMAAKGDAVTAIDVSAPQLAVPGDAVEKIIALAQSPAGIRKAKPGPKTTQPLISSHLHPPGELVLSVLKGLAAEYARSISLISSVTARPISAIHIVGGGSKNDLLCQLTADATGLSVFAGPAEATAIGNILIQALGLGRVASHADLRAIVGRSFPPRTFTPTSPKGPKS